MIDRRLELRVKGEDAVEGSDFAPSFETEWVKSVVPLEALERTLYAMADRATGTIRDGGNLWILEIHPKTSALDTTALNHILRQEINDQSLRVKIAERTDPLRNLVFALAFSRSGLAEPNA